MDTKYIIENLRFEILKPYHNLSNFKSKSRKLNRYLKKHALDDQKTKSKVTHLVICNAELIGYFTLDLNVEGYSSDDYDVLKNEIPTIPPIDKLPIVTISNFVLDKKYESGELAAIIFDNIIFNLKKIFKENPDFDGVSITVGDNCIFPPLSEKVSDDVEEKFEEFKKDLMSRGEYVHVKKVK